MNQQLICAMVATLFVTDLRQSRPQSRHRTQDNYRNFRLLLVVCKDSWLQADNPSSNLWSQLRKWRRARRMENIRR